MADTRAVRPALSEVAKAVVVGDAGVGKSALIDALLGRPFSAKQVPTIAVNYEQLPLSRTTALALWDTAGQERFRALLPSFFRNADVCLLVYAQSSPESFDGVRARWEGYVRAHASEDVVFVLVSARADETCAVFPGNGRHLAAELDAQLCETSSKTGDGVDELREHLVVLAQAASARRLRALDAARAAERAQRAAHEYMFERGVLHAGVEDDEARRGVLRVGVGDDDARRDATRARCKC